MTAVFLLASLFSANADSASSLQILAGALYPAGDLRGWFSPAPAAALRLESPHAGRFRAHIQLQGAYFAADASPASVFAAEGGAGMGWKPAPPWLPQAGGGISLVYVRETKRHREPDRYLFFSDGESEFGFYPFLGWSLPLGKHWTFEALFRWGLQFSEPEWSHFPGAQVGIGRTIPWPGPF